MKKVVKLFRNKRALSAAISNVILTGAVIAISFVVLVWAQNRSDSYNTQYGDAISADIAKLKERLAFEHVFYSSGNSELWIYLINCGTINEVSIQAVYVRNATWYRMFSQSEFDLKYLNQTSTQSLNIGEGGYLVLSQISLVSGRSYSVRIVTGRGSNFDYTFVA
ncbi:MAG: hypothetical protein ACLFU9_03165 [Candidatus Bathyarchaeia archaeon]